MHTFIVRLMVTTALLYANGLALSQSVEAQTQSAQVRELLRNRIEAAGIPPKITVGEETIYASVMLPLFYQRRIYWLAWSNDNGPLPQVDALIRAIGRADREGLRPGDYHLAKIKATLRETRQNQQRKKPLHPRRLVDLDLLLTDAFLIYGSHLLAGRVNPETIDTEWHANRREADLAEVLQTALDSKTIEETLTNLLPPQKGYIRLREALVRYDEIAAKGGWPMVPEGSKMQKGDRGERVAALRRRLIATDDLRQEQDIEGDIFDDALEQAVRRFQQRHGVDIDGVVGFVTMAELNVPVEERVDQIELNMERWRWLPQDIGQSYLLINIANFELEVIENSKPVMTMRVMVGTPYRRTPIFSAKITYLVLNPYWHIPPKIAIQDKLPLIRKDLNYLVQQNIKVFQGWGTEAKEVDPKTIDWSEVNTKNFNYRLRQEPGPMNALGRVKFMFPNKYNVYLHDTPSRELFAKTMRYFSSGCIRIEKPIDLAGYLLKGDSRWTRENLLDAINMGVEQTVRLPEQVAVHLLYWTAWADEEGYIQFRNDIYGRDKLLKKALQERPLTS